MITVVFDASGIWMPPPRPWWWRLRRAKWERMVLEDYAAFLRVRGEG